MTKPQVPTIDVMDPRLPEKLRAMKEKSPIAEAEQVIAKLEQQRDTLSKRAIVHDAERERIAYAARVQGDAEASKRLSAMTEESIRRGHELQDIEAALATAQARLQEAQEYDARQVERERAADIREQVQRMLSAGKRIDAALRVVVEAGAEIHAASDELHRNGCPTPTGQQLLSFGERALRTAIGQTLWRRCVEQLSPGERCTFSGIIDQWGISITHRFSEQKQKEDVA